jgi:hypothetical protein
MSAMVGLARAFDMTVSEMLGPLEETMTTTGDDDDAHAA